MAAPACPTPVVGAPTRPRLEVADIVRAHGEAFARAHALTPLQLAVLHDIARCRTAELGGHKDVCTACGDTRPSYNSCRNRHCPKCQSLPQARWVEQRMARMLPTHAFHVVFTLPRPLRRLAMANRRLVFDALFDAASATLLEFGRDPDRLGAELGITTILHTWNRELRFHPHVHCIVTGGGLSPDGKKWVASPRNYLFPVRALGALFRGKLLDALRKAHKGGLLRFDGPGASYADPERFFALCDRLQNVRWVVYCKPPFGEQTQVFRYLGQYTHRVGISNHRLESLDHRGVTFRTHSPHTVSVPPQEFLRRFVLHVLPKGFVKIRHHGLFASGNVHTKLAAARSLLTSATREDSESTTPPQHQTPPLAPRDFRDAPLALTGLDLRRCRRCGALAVLRFPLDAPPPPTSPTFSHPPPDTS